MVVGKSSAEVIGKFYGNHMEIMPHVAENDRYDRFEPTL